MGVCAVPILDEGAVNEAVDFDSRFDSVSRRTQLDSLIISALRISLSRLHKDHARDVLIGEIFATRRAWGMSPAQVVLYLDSSATVRHP